MCFYSLRAVKGPDQQGPVDKGRDLVWLRRFRDTLERDYARPLDLDRLARGVNVSIGYLSRDFRLAYGVGPYAYLMRRPAGTSSPNVSRNWRGSAQGD